MSDRGRRLYAECFSLERTVKTLRGEADAVGESSSGEMRKQIDQRIPPTVRRGTQPSARSLVASPTMKGTSAGRIFPGGSIRMSAGTPTSSTRLVEHAADRPTLAAGHVVHRAGHALRQQQSVRGHDVEDVRKVAHRLQVSHEERTGRPACRASMSCARREGIAKVGVMPGPM